MLVRVIQDPFDSYIFEFNKNTTKLKFYEAPPEETIITIPNNNIYKPFSINSIEEIFVADVDQSVFILQNEVFDKFGLMVTIDGVVQSTMNYDILTSPSGVRSKTMPNGSINKVYYGNEYKILDLLKLFNISVATVRVLNIRGRGFHSHSGTTILLENDSMVPNTAAIIDGTYQQVINGTYSGPDSDVFTTLANNNFTFTVTHDFILNRGGLNLYANTTCDNLYINLPEMGGEYSPDQVWKSKYLQVFKQQMCSSMLIQQIT